MLASVSVCVPLPLFVSVCIYLFSLPCDDYANIIIFYFMRNPFKIFFFACKERNETMRVAHNANDDDTRIVIIETLDLKMKQTIMSLSIRRKRMYDKTQYSRFG